MSIFLSPNPMAFDPVGFADQMRALGGYVPDEIDKIAEVARAAARVEPDRSALESLRADAANGTLDPDTLPDRIIEAAQALVLKTGAPHPIGQVREAIVEPLRRRALQALAGNAAKIDQSLAAGLAQACADLEAAAQVLGDQPPDPGRTPTGGPVAQEAIQRWQRGKDALDAIRRIRETLVEKCRYGSYPMPVTRWCELTSAGDYDRFVSVTRNKSQLWRAVPAGYQLAIVTPERSNELEAAIAAERAEVERRRNATSTKRHNKRVERELAAWRSVGVEIGGHEA